MRKRKGYWPSLRIVEYKDLPFAVLGFSEADKMMLSKVIGYLN